MIRYVDLRLGNYFCSRIRVLCVDVFRESLESTEDQAVGNSCWVCALTMASCICVTAWLSL